MSGHTAFITGASRGIGKACALALAGDGTRLILAARTTGALAAVAEEVKQKGSEALMVALDLGDAEAVVKAFHQVQKEAGPADILVNNAAITRDGLAVRMKKDDWDAVIQTNLSGAFVAIQQVLPGMMKARWGRVVNITSVVGISGNPGQANYVAAKAGLIGLTKSLAQEMAARNITVNAVAPGFIETDMTAVLPPELKEKILGAIPLKRLGAPADVAAAVKFLCSEDAGYITGQVLSVNGGMYM